MALNILVTGVGGGGRTDRSTDANVRVKRRSILIMTVDPSMHPSISPYYNRKTAIFQY